MPQTVPDISLIEVRLALNQMQCYHGKHGKTASLVRIQRCPLKLCRCLALLTWSWPLSHLAFF